MSEAFLCSMELDRERVASFDEYPFALPTEHYRVTRNSLLRRESKLRGLLKPDPPRSKLT